VVEEGGIFTYYSVYTDHLGSIVKVADDAGITVAEQNYDAWGRERNPGSWNYYAPGTAPAKPSWLYRGYTGHEMLPEYGLINMNGRMYDPANGRMLRPDNYIQDPLNTQSYNRFSYCWNNPLKYTDPTGDYVVIDDLIAAGIGGTINWAVNGFRLDAKGLGYFGAGAAAGTLGLYGPAGWAAGGAILGASNAALGGGDKKQILQGAVIGGMSGIMGGAMGQWASSSLASPMISGLKIGSPILAGAINGTVGGAVGGAAGGFVGGLAITGNPDQAMQMALQGALMGAGIGAAAGTVNGIKYARDNGLNAWTGKPQMITNTWPGASGGRTVINGVEYTSHALERMQPVGTIMKGSEMSSRGVPPSVVENVIKFGTVTPGRTSAEVVRTFENVRVITNPEGTKVITVYKTGR